MYKEIFIPIFGKNRCLFALVFPGGVSAARACAKNVRKSVRVCEFPSKDELLAQDKMLKKLKFLPKIGTGNCSQERMTAISSAII